MEQGPDVATADLGATLDAVVVHLTRFAHFSRPEHATAIALWAAHTHADLGLLEQSPILALTSAVKRSGKTRVLDILAHVVREPWRISRPSEAVLFRMIDRDHPTVLLDEIDTIFDDRSSSTEGIRALFNSGNRQGTKVPRAVPQGRTFGLVEFDVFCPKAAAGIGALPDTVADRAIVIAMERRGRSEPLERLRDREARTLGLPLRDALADHVGLIESFVVDSESLPSELDDRAQDGWEPLLAIADAAGGHWPSTAREAALAIYRQRAVDDDVVGVRLLGDCRTIFVEREAPTLTTAVLREALIELDGAPWADIRGREISPHYLAKLLRPFGISPQRRREPGVSNPTAMYSRAGFEDAWSRYLPEPSGTTDTTGTDRASDALRAERPVPDVPDVPISQKDGGGAAVFAAAWRVFGDDVEWVEGLA